MNSFLSALITQNTSFVVRVILYIEHLKDTEVYPFVQTEMDSNSNVNLGKVLEFFCTNKIFLATGNVFFWDFAQNLYMYIGRSEKFQPLWMHKNIIIQPNDNNTVYLKFRRDFENRIRIAPNLLITQTEEQPTNLLTHEEEYEKEPTDPSLTPERSYTPKNSHFKLNVDPNNTPKISHSKIKRHRQRTIQEVFEIIRSWRELNQGKVDPDTNEFVKLNLEEAAFRIGVPKKSLDDYVLYVNHGKNLNFDFNGNLQSGFGVLRQYVNKMRGKKKTHKKKGYDSDEFDE